MKHLKTINELVYDKWTEGSKNTKLFQTKELLGGSGYYDKYLQGCRHCDKIVKLDNMFEERQLLGNCYQSLCNCSKCGRYVVFDEDKIPSLKMYLDLKLKMKANKYNI
ncbi:hypothetical protein M0Q97_12195 [Candidatus Dojkabacteria bacterium]|jgi:hypothetical protein|nr:hypothetical protein [Candidatus Dojkabacteria bacterium]